MTHDPYHACGSADHFSRRTFLKAAGMTGLTWLTPLADLLAVDAEQAKGKPARYVILLWLGGGPSQLASATDSANRSAGWTACRSAR